MNQKYILTFLLNMFNFEINYEIFVDYFTFLSYKDLKNKNTYFLSLCLDILFFITVCAKF